MSLTAALRHPDYRRLVTAFTISDTGTWAYNVALVVWIFDRTGSVGWVSAITVARFVPAMVLSSYAGVVADRFEKARLMMVADLVFASLMGVLALLMTLGAPPAAVLAVAAVASSLTTVYEPAAAGLTPHLVPERDLASANALRNTIDNVTVIAGPALGALLMLAGPPQNAVWINGASFLLSALLVSRVRQRSRAVDVTEDGSAGPLRQMLVGIRAIGSSPTVAVMVGYSVLATFGFGVDTVLFVAASDQLLGTGPDGYGYLLVGLGIGGVVAAPLVTRLEARPSLGPVILLGSAAFFLPTLVLLVSDSPTLAFAAQLLRGAGTLVVDVLAVTALQRTLSTDLLARVFGAFNTLILGAVLLGSVATSAVIGLGGVEAGVWLAGPGCFAVALLGVPWLRRMDALARERRAELAPRIALLEQCDLVEQVPDGGLAELAGAAAEVTVPAGAVVLREGDPADAFYVVVSGVLAVDVPGAPDLGPGDHLGEIGLLEHGPRTATVRATTDAVLLRIDGETFLDTLTAQRPSAALLAGAAVRLQRTHRRPLTTGATT